MKTIAYCWASGEIGFGAATPQGAIPLVSGADDKVRELISGFARLAYDNETLLVPGVPESEDQEAAYRAMIEFRNRIQPAAIKDGLFM